MKLVDADALKKKISISHSMTEDCGIKTGYEISMRLIDEQPEAVIRCENCIYWDMQDRATVGIAKCNYYSAERYCVYTNSKDYCSGGERKTDEKPI